MQGFTNALKGIGGEYELNRVIGFIAGLSYSFGALAFTAWNMAEGREFDVVAFCTAFGGGAAFITGGTAAAVAWKDKAVASAKVTEQTGAVPAPPLDGPRVPIGDPPPVGQPSPAPNDAAAASGTADERPDYAK